jgi:hypothetical protein
MAPNPALELIPDTFSTESKNAHNFSGAGVALVPAQSNGGGLDRT